jgi:hypothetical protein
VTWTKLLANKNAQRHKTSKKELDNMRALIARDLADAALAGLSADRRFATAYNAALQAANMAIACEAGDFRRLAPQSLPVVLVLEVAGWKAPAAEKRSETDCGTGKRLSSAVPFSFLAYSFVWRIH